MADETEKTENRVLVIYLGCRLDGLDNKLKYHYQQEGAAKPLIFSSPLNKSDIVGARIEVTRQPGGVKGPYVYKGYETSNENPELNTWRTQDRVASLAAKTRQQAEKNRKGIEQEIDQLRFKYKQIAPAQRQIFLTSLIYEITK